MNKTARSAVVLSLLIMFISVISFAQLSPRVAQTSPSKDFPNISISNFGQMDERFYRGARPKEGKGQFVALKALGIQTVIDLTDAPRAYEKLEAEAAGLRYINMPIVDKNPPTAENIEMFWKIVNDPATGVFFAHCAGGRHRTGNIGALYRFVKYDWDADMAYKEMKNYDFYSSWGHGKQKDWVTEYAAKLETEKAEAAKTAATSATGTVQ